MLVECYISVKGVNKYLSSENKLPHTCKDHLEVTKETVKNSQMKQFAHFFSLQCSSLAQIEQSYPILVQKYQF